MFHVQKTLLSIFSKEILSATFSVFSNLKIDPSVFVRQHIFRRRVDRDVERDAFLRHV